MACLVMCDHVIREIQQRVCAEWVWHESEGPSWIGMAVNSHEALIDTGAGRAILGQSALGKMSEALKRVGLRPVWIPRQHQASTPKARGVGGAAVVIGTVLVPVVVVGVSGVVEFIVLQEDAPHCCLIR